MARLIDADAIIDFIDMGHHRNPLETCFSERDVVDMLESAPTMEVVYCRECKYWNKHTLSCKTLSLGNSFEHPNWYTDDFCSYGERKDGDGNG